MYVYLVCIAGLSLSHVIPVNNTQYEVMLLAQAGGVYPDIAVRRSASMCIQCCSSFAIKFK